MGEVKMQTVELNLKVVKTIKNGEVCPNHYIITGHNWHDPGPLHVETDDLGYALQCILNRLD